MHILSHAVALTFDRLTVNRCVVTSSTFPYLRLSVMADLLATTLGF